MNGLLGQPKSSKLIDAAIENEMRLGFYQLMVYQIQVPNSFESESMTYSFTYIRLFKHAMPSKILCKRHTIL